MKRLLSVLVVSLILFSSCNIGEDGLDGDAFLKVNWSNEEPTYVSTNGAIPDNFVWDTYYKTEPGTYTVNFEYTREHTHATVVTPYQIDFEIFVVEGEMGRTHGRDGKDADTDVFFDLTLFPDGDIDFTHEKVKQEYVEKSATIGKTIVYESSETKGSYGMKYTIYRLPEYEK